MFINPKFLLGLFFVFFLSITSYGRPSSKLRGFFNAWHVNFSAGYGLTSYQTLVYKYQVFFKDEQLYLFNPTIGPQTAYLVQWYGKPYIRTHVYTSPKSFVTNFPPLIYSGIGHTVPLTVSVHTDVKKKLRIELGSSIAMHTINQLTPDENNEHLPVYEPAGNHYAVKVFTSLGHKLMENAFCTLLVNTQFSYDFIYDNIFKDKFAVAANYWIPAVGLGMTFEKHISEYVSWFCKFTYDKLMFVEELDKSFGGALYTTRDNFLLQLGLTFTCGEIPMCPVPHCQIEGKHNHGYKTYRGVSIEVGRDSKGYRLYKK